MTSSNNLAFLDYECQIFVQIFAKLSICVHVKLICVHDTKKGEFSLTNIIIPVTEEFSLARTRQTKIIFLVTKKGEFSLANIIIPVTERFSLAKIIVGPMLQNGEFSLAKKV
jgi:hypothetical protein